MQNTTNITILYQDEDFIAVEKPPGLLCVPGLVEPDNLFDQVKSAFPNARVVHRLDMYTSGIVLFGLHYEAQKRLNLLFEKRLIEKQYIAIVDGLIEQECGEIHSAIICDWPNRPRQKLDWINGKHASTEYRILSRDKTENSTRVLLKPFTGRTHQLRVHMLQIGHPILGDQLYPKDGSNLKRKRLTLHAEKLKFNHPLTNSPIKICSEVQF